MDRGAHHPRDEAIRAAMRDAAVVGGSLEAGAVDLAANFADRQIRIRFANG